MSISQTSLRYGIATPVMLLSPVKWALEQMGSKMIPAFATPYLGWASAIAAAIFVGFVIADASNPGTPLSKWIAERRKIFHIEFHPASVVWEGVNQDQPKFSIKFLKPVSDLAIELMLYEHIQFNINKPPTLISELGFADYSQGRELELRAATIERDGSRALWGDGSTNKHMIGGTGNLVEVRAVRRRRFFRIIQRYSVFISYREMEAAKSCYSYLQEDRNVFVR